MQAYGPGQPYGGVENDVFLSQPPPFRTVIPTGVMKHEFSAESLDVEMQKRVAKQIKDQFEALQGALILAAFNRLSSSPPPSP
jgi:hypothetical protein